MKELTFKTPKCFEQDTIKYLLESGVSEKQLKVIQHREAKELILIILDTAKSAIKSEDIDKLKSLTANSPAGDGYGCDNSVLNFSWIFNAYNGGCPLDILGACKNLINLKSKFQDDL